eukprot:scaffold225481_cov20-Prasinocladus_malaysianus.AAC.2
MLGQPSLNRLMHTSLSMTLRTSEATCSTHVLARSDQVCYEYMDCVQQSRMEDRPTKARQYSNSGAAMSSEGPTTRLTGVIN